MDLGDLVCSLKGFASLQRNGGSMHGQGMDLEGYVARCAHVTGGICLRDGGVDWGSLGDYDSIAHLHVLVEKQADVVAHLSGLRVDCRVSDQMQTCSGMEHSIGRESQRKYLLNRAFDGVIGTGNQARRQIG
jgi:hypothetical protein